MKGISEFNTRPSFKEVYPNTHEFIPPSEPKRRKRTYKKLLPMITAVSLMTAMFLLLPQKPANSGPTQIENTPVEPTPTIFATAEATPARQFPTPEIEAYSFVSGSANFAFVLFPEPDAIISAAVSLWDTTLDLPIQQIELTRERLATGRVDFSNWAIFAYYQDHEADFGDGRLPEAELRVEARYGDAKAPQTISFSRPTIEAGLAYLWSESFAEKLDLMLGFDGEIPQILIEQPEAVAPGTSSIRLEIDGNHIDPALISIKEDLLLVQGAIIHPDLPGDLKPDGTHRAVVYLTMWIPEIEETLELRLETAF